MSSEGQVVFQTSRLYVRAATAAHVDLYYALWTDPRVMTNVGFPQGLPITREEIADTIERTKDKPIFNQRLVVVLQENGQSIGECRAHWPDSRGIASTDVKLRPEHWGHKYGVEVKRGLLDYLFTHTDCQAVEGSPNVGNVASIKMQEAVGGVRIAEAVYYPPPARQSYTTPVHYYLYYVYRTDWERTHR